MQAPAENTAEPAVPFQDGIETQRRMRPRDTFERGLVPGVQRDLHDVRLRGIVPHFLQREERAVGEQQRAERHAVPDPAQDFAELRMQRGLAGSAERDEIGLAAGAHPGFELGQDFSHGYVGAALVGGGRGWAELAEEAVEGTGFWAHQVHAQRPAEAAGVDGTEEMAIGGHGVPRRTAGRGAGRRGNRRCRSGPTSWGGRRPRPRCCAGPPGCAAWR